VTATEPTTAPTRRQRVYRFLGIGDLPHETPAPTEPVSTDDGDDPGLNWIDEAEPRRGRHRYDEADASQVTVATLQAAALNERLAAAQDRYADDDAQRAAHLTAVFVPADYSDTAEFLRDCGDAGEKGSAA
jgi:hypothetical protein